MASPASVVSPVVRIAVFDGTAPRMPMTTPVRPTPRTATFVRRTETEPQPQIRATTFVKFVWTGDRIQAGRLQLGSSGSRSDSAGTMTLTAYDLDGVVAPGGVRFFATVGSGARSGPYAPHREWLAGAYDTAYERDLPLDASSDTVVEAEVVLTDGSVHTTESVRFGPTAT